MVSGTTTVLITTTNVLITTVLLTTGLMTTVLLMTALTGGQNVQRARRAGWTRARPFTLAESRLAHDWINHDWLSHDCPDNNCLHYDLHHEVLIVGSQVAKTCNTLNSETRWMVSGTTTVVITTTTVLNTTASITTGLIATALTGGENVQRAE